MAEFIATPRPVRAFQWTGFDLSPDCPLTADLIESLRGIASGVRSHNVLEINGAHGRVVVEPTREVPEHTLEDGRVIPAQTLPGQWVTRDENDHVHVWSDEAFRAAFG